jgi:hypothetical protein
VEGGKTQLVCKADKLTIFCEPIVYEMCDPDISQLYGLQQPVTGIAYFYFHFKKKEPQLCKQYSDWLWAG